MITLIIGLPNAGKTTYSQRFDNVIHADDAKMPFVSEKQKFGTAIKKAAESPGDVVVEGIFNTKEWRFELLKACAHHDKKVVVWLNTPVEECLRREKEYRKRPDGVVLNQAKKFQLPTYDEGWDEIIVIGDQDGN